MSINKVILVGRLGRDPEIRSFPNGGQQASITIATSEKWKDKTTNETKEHTEWHNVIFNGGLVGVVEKYLKKGSLVYVEGSIRSRKWQDKTYFEIRANEMKMLSFKSENIDSNFNNSTNSNYTKSSSTPTQEFHQKKQSNNNELSRPVTPEDDFSNNLDDDVPF